MTEKLPRLYDDAFDEIISVIERARVRAFRAVNRELIDMYWRVGKYVSHGVADGGWGKAVVEEFSKYIQRQYVGIRGFSPSNIWRMRQFYETYKGEEKLATMLRELSWSHNIQIMACKTNEEREFYLEALDREVKKTGENPSVGLILCTKKDETVAEYALSRSLSPALVADYKLHLPDKFVLESKLRELAELAETSAGGDE